MAIVMGAQLASLCFSAPTFAQVAVDPLVSPSPVSDFDGHAFLSLPAHDLEIEGGAQARVQVGDQLSIKILNFNLAEGFKFEEPPATPGSQNLTEQGWEILPGLPLRVIVTKSGQLTLPSLVIRDPSGIAVARTNPLQVTVASAIPANDPKAQEPADLRPPVRLGFPLWVVLVAGIAILAAIAGTVYALIAWNKRRKQFAAPPLPAGPPKPEDQLALEGLAELERQGLMRKGQYKAHCFRISEILKRYIGARYRFDALESTSGEIMALLRERKSIDPEIVGKFESVFERLDRVKFTDFVPSEEEGRSLLEETRELVRLTKRNVASPVSTSPMMQQEPKR